MRLIPNIRIIELAERGADGRDWYTNANRELRQVCDANGWDMSNFCGILAVTSPRVTVKRNIRIAYQYMLGDDWSDGVIRSVRTSVKTWEQQRLIKGAKTRPFYHCLMGCQSSIVLDTWMAYAFEVDKHKVTQVGLGGAIKERIRWAASWLDWTPPQVQAAIWAGIRDEYGRSAQPFSILDIDREFMPF